MEKCPVCGKNSSDGICRQCGFDQSTNYGRYPTLEAVSAPGVLFFKEQWDAKAQNLHSCATCGERSFLIDLERGKLICTHCQKVQEIPWQLAFNGAADAQDQTIPADHEAVSKTDLTAPKKKIEVKSAINAGWNYSVGIKDDGTVFVSGSITFKDKLLTWRDVCAVACGAQHAIGLQSNGRLLAAGSNESGQCDVSQWTDIIAIATEDEHTVGLRSDGMVLATGRNDEGQCDVSDWRDIVAIAVGDRHTVGLKRDGTVVATGDNAFDQCDVSRWKDIVSIAAGGIRTLGVQRNGKVEATGMSKSELRKVYRWDRIVSIYCGGQHTVGRKSDGSVVAVGSNEFGQCDVFDWRNVTAIACGGQHTIGIRTDCTVLAVGDDSNHQCEVFSWDQLA